MVLGISGVEGGGMGRGRGGGREGGAEGANSDLADGVGMTALAYAVRGGREAIVPKWR